MPEELGSILDNLSDIEENSYGDLKLYSGLWESHKGHKVYITTAWSGWGKVSAARATTRICSACYEGYDIDLVLYTGVAGAAKENLKQWDIVIADAVIQHDMDARPLFNQFEIPALKQIKLKPSKELLDKLTKTLSDQKEIGKLNDFGLIYNGLIATGDTFISDKSKLENIKKIIPNLYAVEMEGGAFAQVARQEKIDWIILRVISDDANDSAHNDFNRFLRDYKTKSWDLICAFLNSLYF